MKVKIEFSGDSYLRAFINKYEVGNLDIYIDGDGLSWLNGIAVKKEYRRKGIATKMI